MRIVRNKSRSGFTLIELLVVIGILAVLMAIGIPSVAGIIDRANISADDTNSNEMTNAVERFVSEYELYRQDLSSNKVDFNNLDSAQSRVYNSIGARTLNDIKLLESNLTLNEMRIDIDTKYPMNWKTVRAVIGNYIKTSSLTFAPKQSDMHYYYSPDCGMVVWGEESDKYIVKDSNLILQLNEKIISGKDAKGKELSLSTKWINITIEGEGESGKATNYTIDEINNSEYLFAIGKTKPEYVVAEFDETFTVVTITKNGENSDGLMKDFKLKSSISTEGKTPEEIENEWLSKSSPMTQKTTMKKAIVMDGVISFGVAAFSECKNMIDIEIPESLSILSTACFYNCSKLGRVEFTGNVMEIPRGCFSNCTSLSSAIFQENVKIIDREAFYKCTSLSYFDVPDKCEFIGKYAFYNCSFSTIELPEGLLTIDTEGFRDCRNLKNIKIPSTTSSIGEGVFRNNNSLTKIEVANGNSDYVAVDGVLYNSSKTLLLAYPAANNRTTYETLSSTIRIGMAAFSVSSNLNNIVFNDGLKEFGDYAMESSSNLKEFNIPASVTTLGTEIVFFCVDLITINLDVNNTNFKSDSGAVYSKDGTKLYFVPFANTSDNFVMLPTTRSIESCSFYVARYKNITINEGITELPKNCFASTTLNNVVLPESLAKIGTQAFFNSQIKSITIPANVTYISSDAFLQCYNLTTIYGEAGSYAETWANANGYNFIAI